MAFAIGSHDTEVELVPQIRVLVWIEGEQGAEREESKAEGSEVFEVNVLQKI